MEQDKEKTDQAKNSEKAKDKELDEELDESFPRATHRPKRSQAADGPTRTSAHAHKPESPMTNDKDTLPSDQENGGLKPRQSTEAKQPSKPPPDDKEAEKDPSEQPS